MNNASNAVKAFIVEGGKVLLIKRQPHNPHMPNTWDNPGGRLLLDENPFAGLHREVKEETDLNIEIITPLDVHYFTRDDGQQITLMIFLCKLTGGEIKLSDEHTEYQWKSLDDPIDEFPKNFQCCVLKFREYFQ